MGTATLSAVVAEGHAASGGASAKSRQPSTPSKPRGHKIVLGDGHFLSKTNPTATIDQRDMEALSIRIAQMPEILKARKTAAYRWKTIVGREAPAEAWGARYDEMVEEYVFCSIMKAVNSDANHPKVLGHLWGPPHEWFGMKVPGSRPGAGDNPDNNYSIIPVDDRAHFEIVGQRFSPPTSDVPITLTNFGMMTLGSLDWRDVKVEPDGSFVITVGPEPAKGRSNHIQTRIDAAMILIRDSRADWREVPNAYRVRRLDPPTAPPLSVKQIAERAAEFIVGDVSTYYWFMRPFAVLDENVVSAPIEMGSIGGLVSQYGYWSRVRIADDEAFVLTMSPGGAAYRNLVLQDAWFRTLDFWNRTSNMCSAQAAPNADGSTTYVIAVRDPGVYNWLDTGGLHQLLVLHRWQGAAGAPWVKGGLVKLADLDSAIPANMKRVTPEERRQQLAERLATFKLRYIDN
jgi:hypothetical protein